LLQVVAWITVSIYPYGAHLISLWCPPNIHFLSVEKKLIPCSKCAPSVPRKPLHTHYILLISSQFPDHCRNRTYPTQAPNILSTKSHIPLRCSVGTKVWVWVRVFVCECFVTRYFLTGSSFVAPRPNPKLEDNPFSSTRDDLFNTFAVPSILLAVPPFYHT
jgi:hypothetical protein